ncbi:MAG: hypothetical protein AB8G86_02150 [Saprospiraceae bacterium]
MKQISQLIREIIPVILGILIALVINNWNEERKDKKYLNQIYSSIQEELAESSANIKEKIPKQQAVIDSLEIYLNDETVSIIDLLNKVALPGVTIKNNSWKAIANSRIELIEFEKLSALSDIDEGKESLELKLEKVLDFVYENVRETNREKKEVFQLLIQEIIWTEESLQSNIDDFLKK